VGPGDVYPSVAVGRVERAARRMHDVTITVDYLRQRGRMFRREVILRMERPLFWTDDEWEAALWIMLDERKSTRIPRARDAE
jgi:hypothetical protein